ncbi:exonuclease domain-containing protein [Corynebacterium pseudotuberculosis]|nr:exonuclease domain-containing protein [Corynebacterium pseudotuberculosis]WFP68070.1 exonuclease domain-containing protein [Corynebacterium pseudotuberculosis]
MWWGNSSTRNAQGVLAQVYQELPKKNDKTRFLAVDMETTALLPTEGKILSIGWVPIEDGRVQLADAGHVFIRPENLEHDSVGNSAALHNITDTMLAEGESEHSAMEMLLSSLRGRVLLAHFAPIELRFGDAACRRHFGAPLRVPYVDTMELERRHMERMGTYPRGEDLRLARVRKRYGLPHYRSHNALTDALACAELYLALNA